MALDVYRKAKDGTLILGKGFPAFIHNGPYHQTTICVYEDGMVDCWGLVTFAEFQQKVAQGWVVTQVPKRAQITCHHLFYGESSLDFPVSVEDFVGEVADALKQLRNEPDSLALCRRAFAEFLQVPDTANRERLRERYQSIPTHLRRYTLRDMDAKDGPLRRCIAGKASQAEIATYREWYLANLLKDG